MNNNTLKKQTILPIHWLSRLRSSVTLPTLLFLVLYSSFISAHQANENSAQIYLRDGQVELRLFVTLDHWLGRLQKPQNWLFGDTETLLTKEDVESPELLDKLLTLLTETTYLALNGQEIILNVAYSNHYLVSENVVEFRISAKHKLSEANRLAVQFPNSLGNTNVSVARPLYSVIRAGEKHTFSLE